MSRAVILALLLWLPAWHEDTAELGRAERLGRVAVSIERAVARATCNGAAPDCVAEWPTTEGRELALLLVALGWHETRFARHVHENRCRSYECDPYSYKGTLYFRARGPWQVQLATRFVSQRQWLAIRGSDQASTDAAAWAATRVLSSSRAMCLTTSGTVSMYATGRHCRWRGAPERALTIQRLRAQASLATALTTEGANQ